MAVVKAGLFGFGCVADAQPPSAVEVVFLAVYGMACGYSKEKEANKEEERLSHIKMVCLQKNHGLTTNVQKYLNFVLFSYLKLDEQSKNIAIFAKNKTRQYEKRKEFFTCSSIYRCGHCRTGPERP
jgi:hypothetical protein